MLECFIFACVLKYGMFSAHHFSQVIQNYFALPMLSQAAANGRDNCLMALVQAGAVLDAKDNDGRSALMIVSIKFKRRLLCTHLNMSK